MIDKKQKFTQETSDNNRIGREFNNLAIELSDGIIKAETNISYALELLDMQQQAGRLSLKLTQAREQLQNLDPQAEGWQTQRQQLVRTIYDVEQNMHNLDLANQMYKTYPIEENLQMHLQTTDNIVDQGNYYLKAAEHVLRQNLLEAPPDTPNIDKEINNLLREVYKEPVKQKPPEYVEAGVLPPGPEQAKYPTPTPSPAKPLPEPRPLPKYPVALPETVIQVEFERFGTCLKTTICNIFIAL